MANTIIKLKKSSTPAATPSSLDFGELAINYADGVLFYKNATSHIVSFSSGGNSFGTVNANGTLIVSDTTGDVLTLIAGANIQITADPLGDNVTISATASAGDPVPAFTQANAAYVRANTANLVPVGNTLSGAFTLRATRNKLNFIPGTNITINVDDYSAGDAANITITSTATGGGVTVSDTAPGSPTSGQLWWNSANGSLFIYYADGSSSQWVQTNYPFASSAYLANSNITVEGNVFAKGTITDSYGNLRALPIINRTAAYTLQANDVGRVVSITTGDIVVPNTVFTAGDGITIFNNSSALQNIANAGIVMMYLAGTASVGTRALAQRGLATVYCVAANTFVISGSGLT